MFKSITLRDIVFVNTHRREKHEKSIKTDFNSLADFYYGFISSSSPGQNTRVFWWQKNRHSIYWKDNKKFCNKTLLYIC